MHKMITLQLVDLGVPKRSGRAARKPGSLAFRFAILRLECHIVTSAILGCNQSVVVVEGSLNRSRCCGDSFVDAGDVRLRLLFLLVGERVFWSSH